MNAPERLAEAEGLLRSILGEVHSVRRGGRVVGKVSPMSNELEKKVRRFLT